MSARILGQKGLPEQDQTAIVWSFSCFDHFSKWVSRDHEENHFCAIAQHLGAHEGIPWSEVLGDAQRNHFVPRDRLCKDARDRLDTMNQEDVDELLSFRLTGTNRIWGIKHGPIFRVIWWDPQHRVCPSKKKNT